MGSKMIWTVSHASLLWMNNPYIGTHKSKERFRGGKKYYETFSCIHIYSTLYKFFHNDILVFSSRDDIIHVEA